MTVAACIEPMGVSDARRHLNGRTGQRQSVFSVPLVHDTLRVADLFGDTRVDTTGTLLAVTADPETLRIGLGDKLNFAGVDFDAFSYDFSELLQTAEIAILTPAVTVAPPAGVASFGGTMSLDTARFETPNGSDVVLATVASGFVVLTLSSSFNAAGKVTLVIRDQGRPVGSVGPITVPASGGAAVVRVDSANLAGATLSGFATVSITVQPASFGGTVPTGTVQVLATFRPLRLQSVTLSDIDETFSQSYPLFAGEARLSAIDTIVTRSGSIAVSIGNRLPVALSFGITLAGATAAGGGALTSTLNIPAAPGDGSVTSGSFLLNLAGATFRPSAVTAQVTGTLSAAGPVVITRALTAPAISVAGSGGFVVQRLAGALDPSATPELAVPIEQFSEVDTSGFDFGELGEAVRALRFNDVTATVRVSNTARTPLVLKDAALRVARLDAAGLPVRDGLGNIVFERDSAGNVLSAPLLSGGQPRVPVARGAPGAPAVTTVSVQMGALATRLVQLTFGAPAVRAAVVATGMAEAGDGLSSSIAHDDSVRVDVALSARLDLMLPDTGIVISRIDTVDGGGLTAADSADLVDLLDSASVTITVTNSAPFRVTVSPAYAAGERPAVFGQPSVVTLAPLDLPPAQVNPDGTGGAPTTGTIRVGIVRNQVGALMGGRVTVGFRVRLQAGNPASPRAALRPSDAIRVTARAVVAVSTGTAP